MVRNLPGRSRPWTRRRREAGGQSLVEFAVSMPVLILLLALAYVGWQALHTVIALNGAARAGAVTAANDVRKGILLAQEKTDVTNAVNAEQGSIAFANVTYGTSCASACVALRHALPGSRTSVAMEVVTVQSKIISGVPLLSGFTVTAQAGVAP
ncbi:MAG TPA: TadE/TadG family type IV pilus assembly protein [Candidatus Dormibacteraeota bacterium]|jgi:Flp pilus assembly protein TadG